MKCLMKIRHGLEREVCATGNVRLFETRREAFAPHASMRDVIVALADRAPVTFAARQRLICALLVEQRRAPHTLWTSALTLAFLPALGQLVSELRHNATWAERKQIALDAFIAAIGQLRLSNKATVVLRLHRLTRRLALRAFLRDKEYATRQVALPSELPSANDMDELLDAKRRAERWESFVRNARPADLNGLAHRRAPAMRRLRAHFLRTCRPLVTANNAAGDIK